MGPCFEGGLETIGSTLGYSMLQRGGLYLFVSKPAGGLLTCLFSLFGPDNKLIVVIPWWLENRGLQMLRGTRNI